MIHVFTFALLIHIHFWEKINKGRKNALVKTLSVDITDVRRTNHRDKLNRQIDPPIVSESETLAFSWREERLSFKRLISLTVSPPAELTEGISSWSRLYSCKLSAALILSYAFFLRRRCERIWTSQNNDVLWFCSFYSKLKKIFRGELTMFFTDDMRRSWSLGGVRRYTKS